jgi:hypothetical protein
MLSFQRRLGLPRLALFVFAAFAVHQARYVLAEGSHAREAMAHQGHAYLGLALPLLASLVIVLTAFSLVEATTRRSGGLRSRGASKIATIIMFAVALTLVFTLQESAEGFLSSGHPHGLGAAFGQGGWLALPLSLLFSVALTLIIDTLAVVEQRLAIRPARVRARAPLAVGRELSARVTPLARRALAFGFARRPPPVVASL